MLGLKQNVRCIKTPMSGVLLVRVILMTPRITITNPMTENEIPKVGAQLSEWRVTLHLYDLHALSSIFNYL